MKKKISIFLVFVMLLTPTYGSSLSTKKNELSQTKKNIEVAKDKLASNNDKVQAMQAEIKKAERSGDSDAVVKLKRKLSQFKAIKKELTETASKLKNYYRGEK